MPHKRLNLRKLKRSPEKIPWELRSKASFEAVHSGKIWVLGHISLDILDLAEKDFGDKLTEPFSRTPLAG
jgi:hypothetical protein